MQLLDPATGITLLIAGAWAIRGSAIASGGVLIATSAAWFAGSIAPTAALLHRPGLLAVAVLGTALWGRMRGTTRVRVLGVCSAAILPAPGVVTVLGAALGGTALWGLRRRPPSRGPELLALAVGGLFTATGAVLGMGAVPLVAAYDLAVAGVAVAAAWVSVPRWSVGALAVELSTSGDANSLEQRLQAALRDPTIQLTLGKAPVGGGDAHVTTLRTGHHTVGYLHHRPGLRLPDRLTAGLATVGAMAMDAEQMRRAAKEQLAETERASRVLANARRTEAQRLALRVQRGPIARLRAASESLSNSALTGGAKSSVLADLEHAIEELAVVAGGLAPDLLQSMGLRAALESRASASPVLVDLAIDKAADRLPPDLAYMIFLFCAEALANIAKHADASRAQITVSVTTADMVQVVVGDNGRGIRSSHGSGLRGLGDRARALGGSVTVSSSPDQGTTLCLVVPLGGRG